MEINGGDPRFIKLLDDCGEDNNCDSRLKPGSLLIGAGKRFIGGMV